MERKEVSRTSAHRRYADAATVSIVRKELRFPAVNEKASDRAGSALIAHHLHVPCVINRFACSRLVIRDGRPNLVSCGAQTRSRPMFGRARCTTKTRVCFDNTSCRAMNAL